jgi:glycosyltransferase involved in cell wall biosynthesis
MSGPDAIRGMSVVCCCHNSERTVAEMLLALFSQEIDDRLHYEILLIDNNSSDDTVDIATKTAERAGAENLSIFHEERIGLMHARLKGLKEASQPIILFVDDDNILSNDYLGKLLHIFEENDDVAVVGGYAEPYICGDEFPDWFFEYQLMFACGPQVEKSGVLSGKKRYLYGAGLAFRTAVLRDCVTNGVPPFLMGRSGNELLRGDDTELCYRCHLSGWKIFYDETLRLRHNIDINRITWANACAMRRQTGKTWAVLNMYLNLSFGKAPPSILYMYAICIYRWIKFAMKPRNIMTFAFRETYASIELNYLLGMTWSVIFMAGKYSKMKTDVMRYFRPRSTRAGLEW